MPTASELAKGTTPRAQAISKALNLPGPERRAKNAQARDRGYQQAYENTLPKPSLDWLDDLTE